MALVTKNLTITQKHQQETWRRKTNKSNPIQKQNP